MMKRRIDCRAGNIPVMVQYALEQTGVSVIIENNVLTIAPGEYILSIS